MGTAVNGVHTVSEAENRFAKAVIILQCHFNRRRIDGFGDVDRRSMPDYAVTVEMTYKAADTAFKIEGALFFRLFFKNREF